MPHKTTPDSRRDRDRWTGPASPGQNRFIDKLCDEIQHLSSGGSFQDAGNVIVALKAVRHRLTHPPRINRGG